MNILDASAPIFAHEHTYPKHIDTRTHSDLLHTQNISTKFRQYKQLDWMYELFFLAR